MIAIVDNGKNASEISRFLRMQSQIVSPNKIDSIQTDARGVKQSVSAFILSDGDLKNQKASEKVLKLNKPVLGIGAGCLFVGAAFGAKIKRVPKTEKQERLVIKKPCPLTVDMKKALSVFESYQNILDGVPENFGIVASSAKYEYEIIQEMEKPLFGVHFLPEKGGDGRMILSNFERFVEVWGKYHK